MDVRDSFSMNVRGSAKLLSRASAGISDGFKTTARDAAGGISEANRVGTEYRELTGPVSRLVPKPIRKVNVICKNGGHYFMSYVRL